MVQVPVYDNFQTAPSVRQGRAENPLSVSQGRAAGERIQQTGQNVQRAAGVVADIVAKEQEKANKVLLNDAFNQVSAAANRLKYDKELGYTRLKGADAVKGVEDKPLGAWYTEKLDAEISTIAAKLGNPAVRDQFAIAAGDVRTKFSNETLAYEAEQSVVYAQQVRDATVVQSQNDIAANPLGAAVPFYVSRARDAATESARTAGLDGDALDQAVKATMGKVHAGVIETMLEAKNAAGAKEYYAAHQTDFSEIDGKAIKAKLDTAWSAAEAIKAVDGIVAKYPMRLNAPVNRAKMDADLRTLYKDNPEGLKAARAELSQRVSDHEFQENEQNAGNTSAVWKRLLGGESLASVEGSSAWLALPGDTQASLKAAFLSRSDDVAPPNPQAYAAWGELMNDDAKLRAMTPTQIAALEPFYGRGLVGQLLTRKRMLNEEMQKATAAPGKIDNDLFNSIAQSFGYKPFSKDQNDMIALGRFRAHLETGVAQYQAATGKVVPPSEMETLLRQRGARFVALNGLIRPLYDAGALPTPPEVEPQVLEYMQRQGMDPTPENKRRATLELFEAGTYLVDE